MKDLQTDDTADDAQDQQYLDDRRGLRAGDHRISHSQGGADADPDRVGSPDGKGTHCIREAGHTDDQAEDEDDGRRHLAESVGLTEGGSPDSFEKSGNDEHDPCHGEQLPRHRLFAGRVRCARPDVVVDHPTIATEFCVPTRSAGDLGHHRRSNSLQMDGRDGHHDRRRRSENSQRNRRVHRDGTVFLERIGRPPEFLRDRVQEGR